MRGGADLHEGWCGGMMVCGNFAAETGRWWLDAWWVEVVTARPAHCHAGADSGCASCAALRCPGG